MSRPVDQAAGLAADPQGLARLRSGASTRDPNAIREVARQFESLFAQMMIRNMRAAAESLGDEQSQELGMYTDMFDQQLASEISSGRGLGLADVLMRQLMQAAGRSETPASAEAAALTGPTTNAAPAEVQRTSFLKRIWPDVVAAGRRLGIDPGAIAAQAALETGWGRSLPADAKGSSHNLFGIKAGADQRAVTTSTTEHARGRALRVQADFRAYDNPSQSVADYAALIGKSPRYAAARNTGNDVGAFARALHSGGYATDPHYVNKLVAVATEVAKLARMAGLKSGLQLPIMASTAHGKPPAAPT
jgi:flagellar protein FlgJ